jgi:hypothetical protein
VTWCNALSTSLLTALCFRGVSVWVAEGELGGRSSPVIFCHWRSKTFPEFKGEIPVASNALQMFLCVYAAALARVTSLLKKVILRIHQDSGSGSTHSIAAS